MITYYACVDANDIVTGGAHLDDEGPNRPLTTPPGERYEEIDLPFIRNHPSATAIPRLMGRAVVWTEEGHIDELRLRKIEEMNVACRESIFAGFVSEALGAPHTYPAKSQDQANLVASVTDSLIPGLEPDWVTPFWCVDGSGEWAFRPHTVTQIQRVGREGKAAILAAMTANELLRAQIMAADAAGLESIVWSL